MPLIIVHLQLSNVQKGLQRLFNSDKALANPQVWDVDVDLLGCLDHETDSYNEDFDDAHFWWLWSASCTGNYWFVCTGIWKSKWNGDDNFFLKMWKWRWKFENLCTTAGRSRTSANSAHSASLRWEKINRSLICITNLHPIVMMPALRRDKCKIQKRKYHQRWR